MLCIRKRLETILSRADKAGVLPEELSRIAVVQLLLDEQKTRYCGWRCFKITSGACVIAAAVLIALLLKYRVVGDGQCLMKTPKFLTSAFRPVEDCSICKGLTSIDHISNISTSDFERLYAYSGRPVVITDGTRDWSAPHTFNFEFFKSIYLDMPNDGSKCQFFPYKTEFKNLVEALSMDSDRANLKTGTKPWYFGWSSCESDATNELRRHYDRPYFLPLSSEDVDVDWIFMGGQGFGAHMHVDNVRYPSWQAQISGKKTWRLAPPPECYYTCQEIYVTMQPGEIIVVDTNRWYHQTFVVSEDVSITIGSEFD